MLAPEFDPRARPTGFARAPKRRHYLVTVTDESGNIIACFNRYDDPGNPSASVDVIET